MKIMHNKKELAIVKSSLTEGEKYFIDNEYFPKLEIKDCGTFFAVKGKKEHLFDFLYQLSVTFDIDLC